MTVHAALYSRVAADLVLGPLITNGDSPETFRLYPVLLPQSVGYPAIRYQTIGDEPQDNIVTESNLKKQQIQFDCLSTTFDGAHTLADALDDALTDSTTGFKARRLSRLDLPYESDLEIFRVSMDYTIWHT